MWDELWYMHILFEEGKQVPRLRGKRYFQALSKTKCGIKNCMNFRKNELEFCYECGEFPCKKIRNMDTRYRTRHNVSTMENLEDIKRLGLEEFVTNQKIRWI